MTTSEHDAAAAFLETIRTQPPDQLELPDSIVCVEKRVYGQVGERELTLDYYHRRALPGVARPAIVFLHGGGWRGGSPRQFRRQAAYLALKYDFFAVSASYRLSDEAIFPAALRDAKCAVRWVRANAEQWNIDPEHIAVAGGSAGAHLAAMIAATDGVVGYEGDGGYADQSSRANAAVCFNGVYDLWPLVGHEVGGEVLHAFLGGTSDQVPQRYDEASPIKHLHAGMPPMLLLHGDADTTVSYEQALAMQEKLEELGVPVEVQIYPGRPHGWFNHPPHCADTLLRMSDFLAEQFHFDP